MKAMKIEVVKLKDIFPYYNNPRDNAKAVDPVIESIKRFGFVKPIICDKSGIIIAGHTRYVAAFKLGLEFVPVIYSDMDEEQAKMFRIADNKLSEKSSFDENRLLDELRKMKVPQEMQAFFFEDIDTMLNFSFESIQDAAGGFDITVDYEVSPSESEEPEGERDSEEGEREPDGTSEESDDKVKTYELFVPFMKDGEEYMKVICPYCGNIETIKIDE